MEFERSPTEIAYPNHYRFQTQNDLQKTLKHYNSNFEKFRFQNMNRKTYYMLRYCSSAETADSSYHESDT
jgi:hypothetical protein